MKQGHNDGERLSVGKKKRLSDQDFAIMLRQYSPASVYKSTLSEKGLLANGIACAIQQG